MNRHIKPVIALFRQPLRLCLWGLFPLLAACATPTHQSVQAQNAGAQAQGHLAENAVRQAPGPIPKPVDRPLFLKPPRPPEKQEVYTVVVDNVPVRDLLFSLARNAKVNVDIGEGITGRVTLNAVKETLPAILARIADQVPIRWHIKGNRLVVVADTPYWQDYAVNYPNINRSIKSSISISTQVGASGVSDISSQGGGGGGESGSNSSSATIKNESVNGYWNTLIRNIDTILGEEPTVVDNQVLGSKSVTANRETGMISVYATQKQQKQIQQFLLQTQRSADRQVLIEATVVEVNLNKEHQAGVNWNAIASDVGLSSVSTLTASNLAQPPFVTLTGSTKANGFTQLDSTISMLQAYGTVRVLSSPKIMVLNNQSAILKVVDNKVYFTIKVDITPTLTTTSGGGTATTSLVTYETQVHTVPIGFIMNVTPYVSSAGDITLEVRPTITRIIGYVNDPNPALAQVKVTSKIPEVQVREMESMLRVASGQVAVLGGLMQNSVDNTTQGVPGLANTPYVSDAFSYKDNKTNKTELVIFMRPRVIHAASLNGDLKDFTRFLPGRNTQGPTTGEELQ